MIAPSRATTGNESSVCRRGQRRVRADRRACSEEQRHDERHDPHHLEEALSGILGRGQAGGRVKEALAPEEPAELREHVRAEQRVERAERGREVERAEGDRQAVRCPPRGRRFHEGSIRPATREPGEDAHHEHVRHRVLDVELGERDESCEDGIGAAEERAEDEQQGGGDEHQTRGRARVPERPRVPVGAEELSNGERHDAACDAPRDGEPCPQRIS